MEFFFIYFGISAVIIFATMLVGQVRSPFILVLVTILGAWCWGIVGWLLMPALNLQFASTWLLLLLISSTGLIGVFVQYMNDEGTSRASASAVPTSLIIPSVAGIALLFGGGVMTSTPFQASSYQSLMSEPITSAFSADLSPVDIRNMRQVDQDLARKLADKRLGEIPGLGSRVDVGTMNIQVLNGCFDILESNSREQRLCFENDLIWVGPLNHSGFFKWWSNGTTPGYVMISATDPSRVFLVTALGSGNNDDTPQPADNSRMGSAATDVAQFENLELRYLVAGAYWGDQLKRYLRSSGYFAKGITDYSFEIRDDGRPFWVVTLFEKRVGFSGNEAIGVVVVDAQTGYIEEYSIKGAPSWIDRIQPEGFVNDQLNWQGKLIHGWWNSVAGKRDVRQTTPGMSLVFGADGTAYWYTGIQSAGTDESTMGFVLTNTRTKETRWYQVAGAMETAAMRSAENAPGAREAEYRATYPVLYNVGGEPTYFMTLKGDDGLVKLYAFVSVKSYQIVGIGSSISKTLRSYQSSLVDNRQPLDIDDVVETQRVEVTVIEIVREGEFYFLRLAGYESKEFYASSGLSTELKWTRPGQVILVEFEEGDFSNSVLISRFDNLEIDIE